MRLFCNHVKHMRKFGLEHTTLSLVEFAIEDSNAGEYLASVFSGVDSIIWGRHNNFKEMQQQRATLKANIEATKEERGKDGGFRTQKHGGEQ